MNKESQESICQINLTSLKVTKKYDNFINQSLNYQTDNDKNGIIYKLGTKFDDTKGILLHSILIF